MQGGLADAFKSSGCRLEYNFGHGWQGFAKVFVATNLLAFAVHTACGCLEHAWIYARTAPRARKHFRTITAYIAPTGKPSCTPLVDSKPPPNIAVQAVR